MENASRALIMAGGILIAIIILSILVYMGTTTTRLAKTKNQEQLSEQTAAFNKEYEAYNKKIMYGTDVITVVNKASEYNRQIDSDNQEYRISIEVYDSSGNLINMSYEKEFKNSIFECIDVEYSRITGRVNLMKFIQKEV